MVFSLLASLFVGIFIGIFDLGDSYIYATFGELLYFHWYIPMPPFDHDIPQTLFGPVYSLLILPILKLPAPGGMILLPALPTMMVIISSTIVYYLMKKTVSKSLGILAGAILILFPFTLIYATVIMSEIVAMFLVAVYIFCLYQWLTKTPWATPSLLVILSAVMVLTRYVFLPLFCISIILWIVDMKKFGLHKKKALGCIGIGLIIVWLIYNYNLSGRVGLSTVMGRHLYNNVITSARLAPPKPHPLTDFFYTGFINRPELLFAPWWENQNQFNDGVRTQLEIDRMYLQVSLLTMLHHPIAYVANVFREFYLIATTMPVYKDRHVDFLATCPQVQCQINWNTTLCYPAVFYCPVRRAFSTLINVQETQYPYPMNIFFVFAMVGIIMAIVNKKVFWRYVALLFVVQQLFQSATEWVEGRFIIPLYPLYILLIVYGVTELFRKIFSIKRKNLRHQ